MSQVARLHIRGSLVNATARNLTPEQQQAAIKVANKAFNDSALGPARTEFCAALGRTIGSEYKDVEVALNEVQISFWMTSVDILFHRPKKLILKLINSTCANCKATCFVDGKPVRTCAECGSTDKLKAPKDLILRSTDEVEQYYTELTGHPAPERDMSITTNPIQRKKFFQTCLFNYLRQILRENTYPKALGTITVKDYADRVIISMIKSLLNDSQYASQYQGLLSVPERKFTFTLNTWHLTMDEVHKLHTLIAQAATYGVLVSVVDGYEANGTITIQCLAKNVPVINGNVIERTRVHQISLDGTRNDDDQGSSFREHIETQRDDDHSESDAFAYHDVDHDDGAKVVRDRLTDNGQKIFDIIQHTPDDYIERFGDKVCKAHVADYLGLSPKEVNRQWAIIGLQMRAVDLVPDSH